MKLYKAIVTMNEEMTIKTGEYSTKKQFINDLRKNGYKVNEKKVKEKELFDYIMNETNCNEWDWKLTLKDIR